MKEGKKQPATNLTLPFRDIGGEKLLHFIWQFGYFNKTNLTTTTGEPLLVIFPGTPNKDGGPDFSAARIRIGDTSFFGNVELHQRHLTGRSTGITMTNSMGRLFSMSSFSTIRF